MIPPERMITGYHKQHWSMQVSESRYDWKGLICTACGKTFPNEAALRAHFGEMGVPGFRGEAATVVKDKEEKKKKEEEVKQVDAYNDQNLCVICLDASRQMVNIPCGHLVCCKTCGFLQKTCPICRADIKNVVTVYYA